ncbi:protein kinase, partial [Myxococcota bacterium]|nr:protein kinase [Myxococcota bacterium]
MNEQFGRYTLLERVAIGGMAEIFRASASGFGGFEKILAIKRLHPRFSQDADFIEMLIDEARITVELTHSNIVQIYDLGKLEDHYYIAMEYIDGKDLYRAMRRLTDQRLVFPIDAAAYIAMEALAGLDYAHRKNDSRGRPLSIIHRDISPQNILLSFEGDVKVVDFGIAKAATRATETESGIIKGKFYYMSPEQAKGERLDHRTDIFSLGILFYEMLTGELLYKDEDDVNLLSRVRRADIDLPSRVRPEIPTELEDIVMKALAREREDRYPSAQHMQRDLERFLRDYGTMFNKSHLSQLMQVLFDEAQDQRAGDLLQGRDDYIIDNQSVIMRIPEVEDHGSMEPEFISELMELGDDEMEVVEDPSYRSAYAQPSYEQPQPGYAQPSYEQPQPAYEQPSYEQPQPAYAQPQPNYAQPQPNYEPQQPSYAQPAYEQPPSYAQPSPQGGQARADFAVGHQVVGADYDSIAASFPGDDPFEAEETRAFDPPPRGAARAIEPARAQPLSPPRA